MGHTGGQIIGRNSQGLNARAQWLAAQQARAAAQAAARQQTQGMSQDEAYARYMAGGGRSGSYQRALGENYRTTWHQGQAPQASWGQRLNAATDRWASGIIDRLDEAAVANAGGGITAAAAAVRAPARSALGVVQGAVNTLTLADSAVRAELSEGLSRLMEDPQALLRAARSYYDEHSAGEIAADVYANGAAALMGGRLGAGTHRVLNRVPGLGTDVGQLADAARTALWPNRPVWVPSPDVPYRTGQSGAISIGGHWTETVTAAQRQAFSHNGYLDPITNRFVAPTRYGRIQVDHIFPVNEIIRIPGFRQLTRDQMAAILQDQMNFGNLQPLPASLNASKGPRLAGNWRSFRGQELDVDYLRVLENLQDNIRSQIERQINIFLQANKNKGK
ncbi:MAG: hypothetical protein Q4F13_14025 [Pseudomonadota bacterium]|nr:hypothetical protein [Pseudomonadota bacterium]